MPSRVQTILFSKDKWTPEQARQWLVEVDGAKPLKRLGAYEEHLLSEAAKPVREADLSHDEVRQRLNRALIDKFGKGADGSQAYWAQEVFDDHLIARGPEGKLFRISYTFNTETEDVSLGEPQEVVVSFVPVGESVGGVRLVVCDIPLAEAFDPTTGRLSFVILRAGFNQSRSRFYPEEMLKRDFGIFKGVKMFIDHPTRTEEKERPERSVRDWAGTVDTAIFDEKRKAIVGSGIVIDPELKAKLEELRKHNRLSDQHLSIRAVGEGRDDRVEGHDTKVIEQLVKGRSVDFVTQAGAGGQLEAMEAESPDEIELVTLERLREARPDLVSLIEANTRRKEETKMAENTGLQGQIDSLREKLDSQTQMLKETTTRAETAENELKEERTKREELEKKQNIAEAQRHLDELLVKPENVLPEVSQKRLREQFKEAVETEGMQEAVDREKVYARDLGWKPGKTKTAPADSGKRANLGESSPSGSGVDLTKSFQELGMDEKTAVIAARGR